MKELSINTHFKADDDLGAIWAKIYRLLNDDAMSDESRAEFSLLDAVVHLTLLEPNNQTLYINEFIPGAGSIDGNQPVVNSYGQSTHQSQAF